MNASNCRRAINANKRAAPPRQSAASFKPPRLWSHTARLQQSCATIKHAAQIAPPRAPAHGDGDYAGERRRGLCVRHRRERNFIANCCVIHNGQCTSNGIRKQRVQWNPHARFSVRLVQRHGSGVVVGAAAGENT